MSKVFYVLRHEVVTLVTRFSFWFGAVGVPLIAFLIYGIAGAINNSSGDGQNIAGTISHVFSEPAEPLPSGYVDAGNLIQELPSFMPADEYIRFRDEEAARQALEDGDIDAYFVIAPDYVQSGGITVFTQQFNLDTLENPDLIESALDFNLLKENPDLFAQIQVPMRLEVVPLSPAPVRDQDNALTFFLPYGVTLIFYIMIMGSATLMLNSVGKEKENRVIEILMSSVTPTQLLAGKMLGLGLVGLFQLMIWGGSAFLILSLSGRTFNLPPEFQVSPHILFWGLIYFILGYALYACLMSGLGALVPNIREASQATFIVILPLIVPLFFISILIEQPNGTLALVLSLVPLTSPITMMLRLAATVVPVWQLLLSVGLLIVAVILAIRSAAGMFRAQTLLSGQEFKVKTFLLALVGRA